MKNVITTERLPIKLWLDDLEEGALIQAKNLANLPFAFRHIAIMPDCHQGYGMPIGGVLATKEAIVPNAVGVDIGCGMCSLRTNLKDVDSKTLKKIMTDIRKSVPVGFNHHTERQDKKWMPDLEEELPIVNQQYEKALYQIGTLGGGNHFIEIQEGSDGYIWIMIHSGSRNLGFTVANHYHHLARELNTKWSSEVPKDLAFFPEGTTEYDQYFAEMNYCIEFALQNRKLMMNRVRTAIEDQYPEVEFLDFINKPHNFAQLETHFGEEVMVHRKGATQARAGEIGMIPGTQGTSSFLVIGKGNPLSFESCSHGAGRKMSRAQARKTLDMKSITERLDEKGILHAVRHKSDLDEAPESYKDIYKVMENQKDLVEIMIELKPLAVVKG